MLKGVVAAQGWPLWVRLALTGIVFAATFLFQIPLERDVPGEPFLLFLLAVVGTTLAFGTRMGFVGVGLSTCLSILFFEPIGSLAIHQVADLVKVELYAIIAGGCVVASASFCNAMIAAGDSSEAFKRSDQTKSVLLRELAHGVANNFASVAALLKIRSEAVSDTRAKSALNVAIDQVAVMGRVHRRLRAADQNVTLDSATFLQELCDDLKAMVRGRPLSIECEAHSRPLPMEDAVLLGLIVNELVTNAIKHAFPDGRAGRIRIGFEALDNQQRLSVLDDGAGFGSRILSSAEPGQGQELVRGLTHQLGGALEIESTTAGTSFRLCIPCADPKNSTLH